MNETLALLAARRSVPPQLLAAPGPSPAEIDQLLTMASRVPDHGKLTPWRFLVIEGEARLRLGAAIAAIYRADEPGADDDRVAVDKRGRFSRAPLVIGVVSRVRPHAKIPDWEQTLSAGAVCMNLIVAANAMGFATVWLTEWLAYDRRVLDALGLAHDERLAGFIHLGRSGDVPGDRPRPALADIVTRLERAPMFYETAKRNHGLPHDPLKAIVGPRPIGWITAMSARGEVNLSPYSFFNAVADRPPIVVFSSSGYKDAVAFIDETREFVCNLATWDMREAVNKTSAPLPRGSDEMPYAGLSAEPSRLVTPPRIAGVAAALECRLVSTTRIHTMDGEPMDQFLVMGQVVGVHIADRFIVDGLVDTAAMRPIMRAGYFDYFVATPETRFALERPTTV